MKIAVGSDERGVVPNAVLRALQDAGHTPTSVGPLADGPQEWAEVGHEVGQLVSSGACARGIVFCWSGTGVCIAANKVPGVRAALCADAETARMARRYNHANVLALSLRTTSEAMANEIVSAFLAEPDGSDAFDLRNVGRLETT